MEKFSVEFKDGKLNFGVDSDQDGEKAIKGSVHLNEALMEAISRGDAVEGVKVVDFRFELTKMILEIDTDKDGEKVVELEIDLGEAFGEAQALFKKD